MQDQAFQTAIDQIKTNSGSERGFVFDALRPKQALALADALKDNVTVETLAVNDTVFDKTGADALAGVLSGMTPGGAKELKAFSLRSPGFDGLDVAPLAGLIRNAAALTELTLGPDAAKNREREKAVLNAAAASKSLRRLKLSKIANTVNLRDFLKSSQGLKALDIGGVKIGDIGAELIAEGLAENETLVELDVGSCGLGVKGTVALVEATKGRRMAALRLQGNKIDAGFEDLLTTKPYIVPEGPSLDPDVISDYPDYDSITKIKIDLRDRNLGPDEAKLIAAALKKSNAAVLAVLLGKNARMGEEGVGAILDELAGNRDIAELDLSYCNIPAPALKRLAETAREFKSLAKLSVAGNVIDDKTAELLAQAIEQNKALEFVSLQSCGLSYRAVTRIVGAVKTQRRGMVEVDFNGNQNNAIISEIVRILKPGSMKREINLGGEHVNSLSLNDLAFIEKALEGDETVRTVIFGYYGNTKGTTRLEPLVRLLKERNAVNDIGIKFNGGKTDYYDNFQQELILLLRVATNAETLKSLRIQNDGSAGAAALALEGNTNVTKLDIGLIPTKVQNAT
jgi:Ran GTPase-activating protein (RanGAP) involved in mRNA processing and transport